MNKFLDEMEGVKISRVENGKAYLVEREKTIEVRVPKELKEFLIEKYETVMESRYFGRGGVEIVLGQMEEEEIRDLVKVSRDLTEKE
ncbi:MAG: MmcQ/YjbR family DNA-binding protein [Candidatus Saccharibacteria bacterium]|nr:MmcQ/YjbR family DNA-binding protein [Candidatus Saccharibacteria bacterium]